MADLGAGVISSVTVSPQVKISEVRQSVSGELTQFLVNLNDKNIKVNSVMISVSGEIASLLETPIKNTLRAR